MYMYHLYIVCILFFFFNDTATTEIYTLSLHDALPICSSRSRSSTRRILPLIVLGSSQNSILRTRRNGARLSRACLRIERSEEHTSELQSRQYLVCRLLLEKKIKNVIPLIS